MKTTKTDRGWDRIRRWAAASHVKVKAGIVGDDGHQPIGDDEDGADLTMAELGAIHEYGSEDGTIPQRSFIRRTFEHDRLKELVAFQRKLLKAMLAGTISPPQATKMLGVWCATEVRKTITEGRVEPPLAEITIEHKGSSKPLVDTGALVRSISWAVADGR